MDEAPPDSGRRSEPRAWIHGLCAAVLLLPLTAWNATPVFRSVGRTTAALVTGTGQLSLVGEVATFGAPLPGKVGVGDVLEYDSNGDGARDAIAFVHARDAAMGGSRFLLRAANGALPTPTATPTAQWAVFRAYTTLDNATRGLENPGIGAALRNFDPSIEGKDLVAADEAWNFACYADGEDVDGAALCNSDDVSGLEGCGTTGNHGWRTDATHTVRIYTPVGPTEVGVSQRHTGLWGTGYRLSNALYLYPGFIWVDGLSLKQITANRRAYLIRPNGTGGRMWLSNSFGWQTCLSCPNMRVFDVWGTGAAGTTATQVQMWNDVGVADSSADPNAGVFYLNSDQATYGLFNCTGVARSAGYAFYPRIADLVSGKNCLGVGTLADRAFFSGNRWVQLVSSASNDNSVLTASQSAMTDFSAGVFPNQTFSFVDAGGSDFHLTRADMGARRRGADLSADLDRAFNTDIDSEPRPMGANAWDVGADQVMGLLGSDAGLDAGGSPDGGTADAGGLDGGDTDAGDTDGGTADGGSADAGAIDAGGADGGAQVDGGLKEAVQADYRIGCGCDGTGSSSSLLALAALASHARRRRPVR